MKIHKEGYGIIGKAFAIFAVIAIILYFVLKWSLAFQICAAVCLVLFLLVVNFFRSPKRMTVMDDNLVIAAADGKVVAIKEAYEDEYLKCNCIQVSVLMSIFNVHVNYFPISGRVIYSKYHEGHYIVANHPKASEKNEHTTIVVESHKGSKVLFRQIAGYIARRVVCYAEQGMEATQGQEVGFIKFGSRIDFFLPSDARIMVKKGQNVRACETVIAKIS